MAPVQYIQMVSRYRLAGLLSNVRFLQKMLLNFFSCCTYRDNQSAAYNIGDVLIDGKCGNGVQFSAKDITEPFQLDGPFRGEVLCMSQANRYLSHAISRS